MKPAKFGDAIFDHLERTLTHLRQTSTTYNTQTEKKSMKPAHSSKTASKPSASRSAKTSATKPIAVARAKAAATLNKPSKSATKIQSPLVSAKPEMAKSPTTLSLPRRKIPHDVRAQLQGKSYGSWSSFRKAVNRAWAKSPAIKNDPFFSKANVDRMAQGKNPRSPAAGHLGRRNSMEYDHIIERRDGGKVYDTKNLSLRSPLSHKMKLKRKFDLAAKKGPGQ